MKITGGCSLPAHECHSTCVSHHTSHTHTHTFDISIPMYNIQSGLFFFRIRLFLGCMWIGYTMNEAAGMGMYVMLCSLKNENLHPTYTHIYDGFRYQSTFIRLKFLSLDSNRVRLKFWSRALNSANIEHMKDANDMFVHIINRRSTYYTLPPLSLMEYRFLFRDLIE